MARFRVVSSPQVSGWRFLFRRIEHALVRRDPSMIDDPGRGRSIALLVGVALACVAVAGAAVLSFFKPAKLVGNSRIIADKSSGALYVNLEGRMYPALNLTSARLIIGSPENPVQVSGEELEKYPRGPWVGIPGAPGRMVGTTDRDSSWAVCDTAADNAGRLDPGTGLPTTSSSPVYSTAIGGPLVTDATTIRALDGDEARLVRTGTSNWLLYRASDGRAVRSPISLSASAVTLSLGIESTARAVPATQEFLEAIPEVPALTVPTVEGAGAMVTLSGNRLRVGSVLTIPVPDQPSTFYVVTRTGLVQVSPVVAAMIRNSGSGSSDAARTVDAKVVSGNLRPGSLPGTEAYPVRPVELVTAESSPVACYHWKRGGTESAASTSLLVGRQLPLKSEAQTQTVALVTASESRGRTADAAYLPPTSGRFVQVTGADPASPRRESLWWVSDSGVRYGIEARGDQTLQALGIGSPVPAPWSIVSLFAPGATLSQRDARVQHDGIPPNPTVAELAKSTP